MKSSKNKYFLITGVVLLCFLVDGIGHMILPASPYMVSMEPSLFSRLFGTMQVAMLYMLLLYIVLGITISVLIQKSSNPIKTGIVSGLSLGGLWFIAFFETWAVLGSSLIDDLIMGLNDSLPIVLMGALLALVYRRNKTERKRINKINPYCILITAIFYVIGRIVLYFIISINSGIDIRPLETIIWTVIIGLWIGIIYQLIFSSIQIVSRYKKAILFSIIIFGVNWVLFNLFLPVVFTLDLIDFLIRSCGDVVFIFFGTYVSEYIFRNELEANKIA